MKRSLACIGLVAIAAAGVWLFRSPTHSNTSLRSSGTRVDDAQGWPRTLVELSQDGTERRRVQLTAPPERIVSLTLATDELLMDLVDPARIAALSYLASSPQSRVADRVGAIQDFVGADVESILALEPDLCFLAHYNREELRSLLIEAGVPVFVFQSFDSLVEIRRNITTVGRAVGADEKAERLVARMNKTLSMVAAVLPPKQEWPSALVYGQSGWVSGAGTLQSEVLEAAGLRNAAAEGEIEGYAKVSEERVLSLAPDYLIILEKSIDLSGQKEWLLQNPALQPLEAIQKRRFLTIEEGILSSVSHHVVGAVVELARQTYPDRFPND